MKTKLIDITPAAFACQLSASCPAVFKSNTNQYVIIGKVSDQNDPTVVGCIGEGEIAVQVPAELLNEVFDKDNGYIV